MPESSPRMTLSERVVELQAQVGELEIQLAQTRAEVAECHPAACRDEVLWRRLIAQEAEWWAKFGGQPCTAGDIRTMADRLTALHAAASPDP
jgi:hypothetical protein